MVSSRVHTQLMQIADERAQAAERKALELEKEVSEGATSVFMYHIQGCMCDLWGGGKGDFLSNGLGVGGSCKGI